MTITVIQGSAIARSESAACMKQQMSGGTIAISTMSSSSASMARPDSGSRAAIRFRSVASFGGTSLHE